MTSTFAQEDVALWKYGAEPGDGSDRTLVDAIQPNGHLSYDVEGVTIAATGPTSGYLIVSAQNGASPNQSYFSVYDRQTNAFLSTFRIAGGSRPTAVSGPTASRRTSGTSDRRFPKGCSSARTTATRRRRPATRTSS